MTSHPQVDPLTGRKCRAVSPAARVAFVVCIGPVLAAVLTGCWQNPPPAVPTPQSVPERVKNPGTETVEGEATSEPDTNPDSRSAALAGIAKALADLTSNPIVSSGTVGFYLAPLDQPDVPVLRQNETQSFITASTMKTLTTGAALQLLGPQFRFETRLYYLAATGDLMIVGSGDPTLGRPDWEPLFEEWTSSLRKAGIREIRGRILADESAWEEDELPGGWTWLDIGNYYAPVLTPLCFHDNAFRMYFALEGEPGEPAGFYDAEPWPPGLEVQDSLRIGRPGSGDQAYVFGAPGADRYTIRGTLAADSGKESIRAALPDPAELCAREFTGWLNARQIPVHGQPLTSRKASQHNGTWPGPDADKQLVSTHSSLPLGELLIQINHRSLNLDCECLLRTIGEGKAGQGLQRIRQWLQDAGLPLSGYEQTDGSGLSRTNMIPPQLMARANALVLTGSHGAEFLESLPPMGSPGSTLRRISPQGNAVIQAKSGTIERVKGYTGVVLSPDGSRYIFALLVNNYDGSYSRAVGPRIEAVLAAMAEL